MNIIRPIENELSEGEKRLLSHLREPLSASLQLRAFLGDENIKQLEQYILADDVLELEVLRYSNAIDTRELFNQTLAMAAERDIYEELIALAAKSVESMDGQIENAAHQAVNTKNGVALLNLYVAFYDLMKSNTKRFLRRAPLRVRLMSTFVDHALVMLTHRFKEKMALVAQQQGLNARKVNESILDQANTSHLRNFEIELPGYSSIKSSEKLKKKFGPKAKMDFFRRPNLSQHGFGKRNARQDSAEIISQISDLRAETLGFPNIEIWSGNAGIILADLHQIQSLAESGLALCKIRFVLDKKTYQSTPPHFMSPLKRFELSYGDSHVDGFLAARNGHIYLDHGIGIAAWMDELEYELLRNKLLRAIEEALSEQRSRAEQFIIGLDQTIISEIQETPLENVERQRNQTAKKAKQTITESFKGLPSIDEIIERFNKMVLKPDQKPEKPIKKKRKGEKVVTTKAREQMPLTFEAVKKAVNGRGYQMLKKQKAKAIIAGLKVLLGQPLRQKGSHLIFQSMNGDNTYSVPTSRDMFSDGLLQDMLFYLNISASKLLEAMGKKAH